MARFPALAPGGGEGALRPSPLAHALDGEHKQVTVLCGTLAEAPTLARRLGPEAMYHLMRDVLALAQDTVQRYGGTLLQVSGEGFVALFGAPMAQEDHARRAVLAALELRQRLHTPDALRGQPHGVTVRLGLHSGPVVVGSLGHEPHRPYTAGGATLGLATRLQQQATPDTVLLSAATYALVQTEVEGEVWAVDPGAAASPAVAGYVVHGLPAAGGRPTARRAASESPGGPDPGTGTAARAAGAGGPWTGAGRGPGRGARHGQVAAAGGVCP